MTTKTASEILLEAANLLEEEQEATWGKGSYFQLPSDDANKPCIMCAHGAIAYCGDNEIKKNINGGKYPAETKGFAAASAMVAVAIEEKAPCVDFINKENIYLDKRHLLKHYGEVGLAHYKAAKAGLTFNYNDKAVTSKQDVINKLREAATL